MRTTRLELSSSHHEQEHQETNKEYLNHDKFDAGVSKSGRRIWMSMDTLWAAGSAIGSACVMLATVRTIPWNAGSDSKICCETLLESGRPRNAWHMETMDTIPTQTAPVPQAAAVAVALAAAQAAAAIRTPTASQEMRA